MGKTIAAKFGDGGELISAELTTDQLAEVIRDPMPSVEITKAQIKDGLFLNVSYSESTASGSNEVSKKCTAPIHDDLRDAFKKLDDHLATICGQYDEAGSIDVDNVSCRGFAVGGSGDHQGVTLIGTRSLTDEKIVNLTSPFTKWSDDYGQIARLRTIVNNCSRECKLYLFEGKQKPQDQKSLFDDQDKNGEF